jgi:hypothetical protein
MMGKGQKLRTRLHELEKRLSDLEIVFGGLMQKSESFEAVVELLVDRRLIPRREVSDRVNRALEPYRERIGQYAEEELQKLVNSILDGLMESFEEGEMPHA